MTFASKFSSSDVASIGDAAGSPATLFVADSHVSSDGRSISGDTAALVVLAAIFIVIVGAMATPAVIWTARNPLIRRGAALAARAALRYTFWQGIRRLLFVLPLVTTGLYFTPEAAQAAPREARFAVERPATGTIEDMMARIKSSKKPLPVWALDLAMRAYDIYLTYQSGKRVGAVEKRADDVEHEVQAILKVVLDVQKQVEAGREMTDREFRLTRELLDSHGRRLNDLTGRVARLEREAAKHSRQLDEARGALARLGRGFRRPGCGVGRAWRNGKCVDVAANPR
ncbi:MAG: hypothetical protein AB7E80_07510 [Hyphomicrobiaceae bacterium]